MWHWSENALLKTALRLYAGEHVLSRVLAEGKKALELSSQRTELTVMFVDVVGYKDFEDPVEPARLWAFMNSYLQVVTDSVLAQGGVLDGYVGDSVSAWWHDPASACTAARQLVRQVESLNRRNSSAHLPGIKLGIGINTGVVTLGNYGSSQRLKFTVLGDNVNLASRICGLANRQYKEPIVISGATQQLLDGRFETRLLETLCVKGRDESVPLFALQAS